MRIGLRNEYYGFYNKVTVIKPTSIETDDNFNYSYGYDYDDMYYYSSYSSVKRSSDYDFYIF